MWVWLWQGEGKKYPEILITLFKWGPLKHCCPKTAIRPSQIDRKGSLSLSLFHLQSLAHFGSPLWLAKGQKISERARMAIQVWKYFKADDFYPGNVARSSSKKAFSTRKSAIRIWDAETIAWGTYRRQSLDGSIWKGRLRRSQSPIGDANLEKRQRDGRTDGISLIVVPAIARIRSKKWSSSKGAFLKRGPFVLFTTSSRL